MLRTITCTAISILVLSLVPQSTSYANDPSLVGWWTFDDGSGTTPLDSSDYGRDGEFVGSPEWTDGHTGGALRVSQGNYVVIPGYKGVLGPISRTCMAWIKTTTAPGVIFGWAPVVAGAKWIVRINDGGQLRCEVHNGYHYGTTILTDDQWHHVAVVLVDDGSPDVVETLLYVDGVLETSNADSADEPINTAEDMDVTIGQNPHATNRWFDGLLDEARIYDRALTQAEIQAVMNEAGQGFPVARVPLPEDGSLYENTWASLSWRPGDFAVSNDLYFAANFDDVNDGAEEAFASNTALASQVVGFPGFPAPGGLQPGVTYYWRVDGINDADPNSPWKGTVWSFSIPPKTAYNPDPADGAEFVDPGATFTWTGGYGSKLHTVYLGEDYDDVSNAVGGMPLGTPSYDPGTLEPEKVLYWRVDEFDGIETHKGGIWSFTTPGAVGNPQPANGAVDVQMISTLSWTPAETAASHELYVGTDADAVKNATTASPEYVGPRALGAESYNPGGLAWNSSYAWRVDEVYPSGTVKGLVWAFTTADFILVDDFESYDDIDPLGGEPGINRIFDKWIDGFASTTNGALVGHDLPPYAEQTVVHGGGQSLVYRYENTNKISEATLTLVYPRDWTDQGVAKLSLWFRGASANAADRMFVALNGTSVVYHDDPDATQIVRWTEWVIDLQAFADVELANVTTMTIGFGTKNPGAPGPGGQGTLYFDDIALYRPAP
ncbi:MAG: LamG domain-containing protein [Phycisphaerae bacterium]|nr:LamG domain-containing protein [Phycisphaerae bacterium]